MAFNSSAFVLKSEDKLIFNILTKRFPEAELKQNEKRTDSELEGLDSGSSVTITKSVTTSSCTTSRQSK